MPKQNTRNKLNQINEKIKPKDGQKVGLTKTVRRLKNKIIVTLKKYTQIKTKFFYKEKENKSSMLKR